MPSELQGMPAWGWVITLVGSVTALAFAAMKITDAWFAYKERCTKQRMSDQSAELEHEKQKIDLEKKRNEYLYLMIDKLNLQIREISDKAEETRKAHEKDVLKALENETRCREEVSALKTKVAHLESEVAILKGTK